MTKAVLVVLILSMTTIYSKSKQQAYGHQPLDLSLCCDTTIRIWNVCTYCGTYYLVTSLILAVCCGAHIAKHFSSIERGTEIELQATSATNFISTTSLAFIKYSVGWWPSECPSSLQKGPRNKISAFWAHCWYMKIDLCRVAGWVDEFLKSSYW